jgi:hypothetical protein
LLPNLKETLLPNLNPKTGGADGGKSQVESEVEAAAAAEEEEGDGSCVDVGEEVCM